MWRPGYRPVWLLVGWLAGFIVQAPAGTSRIKDVAVLQGVRPNQLNGYGLVVGLSGTGDKRQTLFTIQSLTNMLERMGVQVDPASMRVANVAAVMVTASLPAFARAGQAIDITVSSIGDASSLQGGTLLLTALKGLDGQVYAIAQGSLVLGGYRAGGRGNSEEMNHPTVGRIPAGATVEREIPFSLQGANELVYILDQGDFSSCARMAAVINQSLGGEAARALDSRTVLVKVPDAFRAHPVELVSRIEGLSLETDEAARVVIDEKTGTIVMGREVKISGVAVMHGNLSVSVSTSYSVSQPAPFSEGTTKVVPETAVRSGEEPARNILLKEGATVEELVRALNAIGVTPRDVVAIMSAIRSAGALKAQLEIM